MPGPQTKGRSQRPHGRTPRSPLASLWLAMSALVAVTLSTMLSTRPAVGQVPATPHRQTDTGAVLYPSEEATTLLSRAREGAARQDWKLVVDSLQRIIELPGDHILATSEIRYESARQHAQRQLAELSPEGLRAYRLIYDGQAAVIFNQAVSQHDETALRRLVDRSFLTSHGDDAAVTLADWLVDEGRFLEAGVFLRLVRDVYPDSDLPAWAVPLRLAVCMAGLNRTNEAHAILDQIATRTAGEPPEVQARVQQVRGYIGRASTEEIPQAEHGWPMAYGRSLRDNNMSSVEPTFISHLPWNVALPVPPPKSGPAAIKEHAAEHQLIPAAEMTTDGRVIVVKSGANLMGLDRDTFDPLWTTRSEQEDSSLVELEASEEQTTWQPWQGVMVERTVDDRLWASPHVRRLYHDSVGNQVCLAAGLAVTVEWPGDPPDTLSTRGGRNVRRHPMPMAGGAQSHPNFVVAYSLADGSRVWTSDTSSGPHALGPVQFLGAPIVVDNSFLATCRVNDDLYAVVLDPRTGRIVRHIYLCGTGGAQFDSLYACMPCVADGIVFIPTGRGVLVAVDVANWSIRWALRYDHLITPANEFTWHPTPVMAASDVILLAPADADGLLCIERATGELRWQAPRDQAAYVLAAGEGMVWTVGETVYALDLNTGSCLWETHCDIPAGRGARSGNRLYLPTQAGLFVLDARTGELVQVSPVNIPAGNLLAYEDALYVASAFEIRKYPDMNRGYDQAILAHQRDRSDLSLAMRLGWLEYLRGRPAEALAVLSHVPQTARLVDEQRYGRLVHLKIVSMLDLASAPETKPAAALELLEEAQQIAQTTEDAITARLALGEFHERSQARDGLLEACLEYAALAYDPTGDQMMNESADAFERKAVLLADRQLADLLPRLSAAQTENLTEALQQRLAEAIATRNTGQLRRISSCAALTRLAVQADMALGVWAARDLAYEQAEACLRRVIERAESPELIAEALARLAIIHLQPGELHLPVSGTELLRRMSREFAAVPIPADVLETEWPAPAAPGAATDRKVPASEVARLLQKRVDARVLSEHEDALHPMTLGTPGNSPEATAYPNARPIVVRGKRTEPLADRMLLFVDDRTVEARRVEDGELLWPAELRLLGEMIVESQTTLDNRFPTRIAPSEPARGLVHGQTLVVNTRYGIHAVGLLTGRRLWSRRFDPPYAAHQNPAGSDSCIWIHDGYLISVDSYGHLEVARVESGTDVLWRRRVVDRHWQTVRATGDFLVLGDAGLQQVDVFRLSDGTHLGMCTFTQPSEPSHAVNVAVVDNAICGPASPQKVAAMELGTPGLERWPAVEMDDDLSQIFKPAEDVLAIADRTGGIKLIDPTSGETKLDVEVPDLAGGIVDGRIDAGVLYIYGLHRRSERPRPGSPQQQWSLAAIRVDSGDVLWSKTDLGPQACLTPEVLTVSTQAIPVLAYRSAGSEMRGDHGTGPIAIPTARRAKVELMILDKATGATIGDTVSLDVDSADGAAIMLDLQVWPNRATAFVGTNYIRFGLLPPGGRGGAASEIGKGHPRPALDDD